MQEENNSLFFCADDFGLDEKTNARIVQLAAEKKIQRVAALVGEKSDFSHLEQLQNSGVKLDLHLTLTEDNKSLASNISF